METQSMAIGEARMFSDTIIDQWATAWCSHDVDRVLRLFTDNCTYEDVPIGVVNRGKDTLRVFAEFFFSVAPDFKIEVARRFEIEGVGGWRMDDVRYAKGRHAEFTCHRQAVFNSRRHNSRT